MSSLFRSVAATAGVSMSMLAMVSLSNAAAPPVSFSAVQAERGHQLYLTRCSVCHGASLEGVSAPSLTADAGPEPSAPTVGDVFTTIVHRMPKSNPGSLAPNEAADIEAYLLSSNGFSAGAHDLTPETAVASTMQYLHQGSAP